MIKLSRKQYNAFVVLVDNLSISQDAEILLVEKDGKISVTVFDKHVVSQVDL